MNEEQNPAPEAGAELVDDAVQDTTAQEDTVEETEGQVETQPAEAEDVAEDEQKKSRSKERRERRKAELQQLRASEQEARAKLDRIMSAAEGEIEPKRDDFDDPDEYVAAKAAFNGSQAYLKRDQEALNSEVSQIEQQAKAELAQMWDDQVTDARSRYADFDQVAFTAPITDTVADMIAGSDNGADVAYYLGQNPQVARQISQAQPIEAAMEIGRIAASISLPKPQTTTQAPQPISPVTPKASASANPERMSYAEYKAAREAGKI